MNYTHGLKMCHVPDTYLEIFRDPNNVPTEIHEKVASERSTSRDSCARCIICRL